MSASPSDLLAHRRAGRARGGRAAALALRGGRRGRGGVEVDADRPGVGGRPRRRARDPRVLGEARPDDAILGEEGGETQEGAGLRWIVDPLDGTVNFLYGIPQWCVSVAVHDDAGGVAGVVYDPLREELFAGCRGGGRPTLNGVAVRGSSQADLARALIAHGLRLRPGGARGAGRRRSRGCCRRCATCAGWAARRSTSPGRRPAATTRSTSAACSCGTSRRASLLCEAAGLTCAALAAVDVRPGGVMAAARRGAARRAGRHASCRTSAAAIPGVGFEPTIPHGQSVLSRSCIPVPAPGRDGDCTVSSAGRRMPCGPPRRSTSTLHFCEKPRPAAAMSSSCSGMSTSVSTPTTPAGSSGSVKPGVVAGEPLRPADRAEDEQDDRERGGDRQQPAAPARDVEREQR